jgi:N-acetylneuraminate synthase
MYLTDFIIGNHNLGNTKHVFIIAEACDNHMGDIETAKEMIRLAKLSGCDCIKFQHHLPDEEMLRDVPMSSNFDIPLYDFLKLHALSLEQHIRLKNYCDEIGIMYLCTPFSLKAAYELNEIGVTAFKIGSGEMTDIPTLLKIADLGKPMIISTGMCTLEEIKRTYIALLPTKIPLAFTNCLSEYPPKYQDINLGVITKMKKLFPETIIGHSDHSPDLYTCFAAVALGAKIVEKHVIIDKKISGPDQSVSIDFNDLYHLVDGIRKIELALGDNKKINDNEKAIREWAFRSIVSTKKLKKGEKITQEMIWSKRPGTGIPSYRMDELIGKTLIHDIDQDVILSWEDFI